MPTAVVATNDGVVIKEIPPAALEPGTLRIKTAASLISRGTESAAIRKALAGELAGEVVMGYVSAGVVTEVGAGVTKFKPGDRVAGIKWAMASHATEAVVPQNTFIAVPDEMEFEEAVFSGLAGIGLHAARQAKIEAGGYCIVAGAGLIGQFSGQFARIAGAHVMFLGRHPGRLEIARQCGAEATVDVSGEDCAARAAEFTRGRGAERGIIAVGGDLTEAFAAVLECMTTAPDGKRCGRISVTGLGELALPDVNTMGNVEIASSCACGAGYRDAEWERRQPYTPGYVPWQLDRNLEEIIRCIADGSFRTRPLLTHRMPFAEAAAAWDLLLNRPDEALGVVLSYD